MEKHNEKTLIDFGMYVKKLRKDAGLIQDHVVANSNRLIKAKVSDVENGKRNLSFTTLIDLAKGMNKHPRELFDFKFDLDIDL